MWFEKIGAWDLKELDHEDLIFRPSLVQQEPQAIFFRVKVNKLVSKNV
jgi:hypothetical protein